MTTLAQTNPRVTPWLPSDEVMECAVLAQLSCVWCPRRGRCPATKVPSGVAITQLPAAGDAAPSPDSDAETESAGERDLQSASLGGTSGDTDSRTDRLGDGEPRAMVPAGLVCPSEDVATVKAGLRMRNDE